MCETLPPDGNGSVVEISAQNWTPLDREVQHEFVVGSRQRATALLGWTCDQGLFGDLRKSLHLPRTTVVEMAPTGKR